MPRNANGDSGKVPFPRRCCPQACGRTLKTLLEAGRKTLHPLLFSGDEKRRKEERKRLTERRREVEAAALASLS